MISERELDLVLRRQRAQLRSAALRSQLAEQAVALQAPLAAADRIRDGAHWLYRQRGWVLGGALVLLALRPRRAWRVLRWSWWLWRNARRVRPWLAAWSGAAAQRY